MDVGKLEQAIRAAPDDPTGFLVYGDWLQSEDDPRGELIAVQAKLASEPSDALFTREHELIAANERAWLGEVLYEERARDRLICEWHYGFLHSVTVFATSEALFATLAACPSAKFLRRIVIDTRETFVPPFVPKLDAEVIVRGDVHPPRMLPALRLEAEAAMAAVLEESERKDDWGSEFPNPHSPELITKEQLARADFVGYLVEQLGVAEDERVRWARFALLQLGPAAASAAHALTTHECWLELFCVAPDLARSLGVHRRFVVRERVSRTLFERDPRLHARNLADALESEDANVLVWALDGTGFSDRSFMERLAHERPRLISVARLDALLRHADERVRNHACARLLGIRDPKTADAVIDAILDGRAKPRPEYAMWLGSHPKSDRLLALTKDPRERFHLQRRRRCAGLARDVERLDDENHARFTLDRADERFLEGRLDNNFTDDAALGSYARVLLNDPTCAPAAFRIAWIERGYGAPITPERIAWLRGLGVSEQALARLEKPTPEVVPGFGYGATIPEENPVRAAAALAAELPSLAAWYLPQGSVAASAAREAAKLQLPLLM